MNSKNRLENQAVFAVGLVGQLLLLDVSRRLMVHDDDVIMVNPDMRRQNLCLRIDGVALVLLRRGGGDQSLVAPSPLVAAFGGFAYPLKFDVLLLICNLLRHICDDLVA